MKFEAVDFGMSEELPAQLGVSQMQLPPRTRLDSVFQFLDAFGSNGSHPRAQWWRASAKGQLLVAAVFVALAASEAEASFESGRCIVRFKPGALTLPENPSNPMAISAPSYSPVALEDSLEAVGGLDLSPLGDHMREVPAGRGYVSFRDVFILTVPPETSIPGLVTRLRAISGVADAEPAYDQTQTFSINDPLYPDQWHLENSGQGNGLLDVDIDVEAAWDSTAGSQSVTVFVIDTGVDDAHSDLSSNLNAAVSGTCTGGSYDDPSGHGTHCAGLIAAQANSIGVRGVAPGCRFAAVRAGDPGWTVTRSICALDHCFGYDARITSCSWGQLTDSFALAGAVRNLALADTTGGLIVAAAGNQDPDFHGDPIYPVGYERLTLGVSAVERGGIPYQSGYYGDWIDLCAPGGANITTTSINGTYVSNFGGTSAATPIVAGVAALVLSRAPGLYADDLAQVLTRTATDILPAGWDLHFGAGLVNAHRAVEFVSGPSRSIVHGTVSKAEVATSSVSEYYLKTFKNLGWCFDDPALPDAPTTYLVKRHDMTGNVTFSSPYLKSVRNVWVRKKDGLLPGWRDVSPLDCVREVGFGSVDGATWDSTYVDLKASVFALYQTADSGFVGYFPAHPDSVEIPYTAVLGEFDDVPFVEVHKPNGGESWVGGSRTVTWAFSDDDGRDSVSVFWSLDSGVTWPYLVGNGITADTSWVWVVAGHGAGSPDSRIAIVGHDSGMDFNYDMSDADFLASSPGSGEGGGSLIDRETGLAVDGVVWKSGSPGSIAFRIEDRHTVLVDIYTVGGRLVRRLANKEFLSGTHEVTWNGTDALGRIVSAGVYLYRVEASPGGRVATGKIVIVK